MQPYLMISRPKKFVCTASTYTPRRLLVSGWKNYPSFISGKTEQALPNTLTDKLSSVNKSGHGKQSKNQTKSQTTGQTVTQPENSQTMKNNLSECVFGCLTFCQTVCSVV